MKPVWASPGAKFGNLVYRVENIVVTIPNFYAVELKHNLQ